MSELDVFDLRFEVENYWRLPMKSVRQRDLRRIFRIFQEILPDHPDEDNTVLYLLKDQYFPEYQLLWTCSHFECSEKTYLPAIMTIMEELAFFSGRESVGLELLDSHCENLVICVNALTKDAVRSLKRTVRVQGMRMNPKQSMAIVLGRRG